MLTQKQKEQLDESFGIPHNESENIYGWMVENNLEYDSADEMSDAAMIAFPSEYEDYGDEMFDILSEMYFSNNE